MNQALINIGIFLGYVSQAGKFLLMNFKKSYLK